MKSIIQNVQLWMNKNREWLWLLGGVIAFISLTDYWDAISEFSKGFSKGLTESDCNCDEDETGIGTILGLVLFTLFIIGLFFGIIAFLGNFFYHFFFKYILQKSNAKNVIAFILWLVVFYGIFWEGLHWIFEKNNAFEMRYVYDGVEKLEDYKKKITTEYRDNYTSILTALIFGLIIIYIFVKNFITTTKIQAQLITQKSQAELAALKAQINPHFLFNVLNNLYGTAIVEESPKTSEGILQLSSIMRHVVEGTKNEKIELEKEVRFMNDYLDLSKIRIPNRPNIRIETQIDIDETPTMIAPLLVIPYLENAFKYGISMNEECFIEMSYVVKNQQLEFFCRNSIIKKNDKLEVGTGTGLENTKKRLDLYYPAGYQLSTDSSDGILR
jgi:Histidine kinase